MAQNEPSVPGDVVWQDGDDLSETHLTRTAAKSNQTDYVERGLGVTVDGAAGTIDINSGHCIIQDGVAAYDVFPDQITDISLPAPNGTNHVFVQIDETTDDTIAYHVDDDDSPPTQPSLKIATVDGGAGSATALNRAPDGDFTTLEINGQTGAGVPAASTDSGIGFGTWRQPSASRPVFLVAQMLVRTDGSTDGQVTFAVDESGGTSPDYDYTVTAPSELGNGSTVSEVVSVLLPAGAQYKFFNTDEPFGNAVEHPREFVL